MRKGMRRTTSFRLLIAGLAVTMAGPAVAQSCVQPAERQAFDVRAVQSQLQVAALLCRDNGYPQLENEYRAFVQKFQGEFQAPARALQAHFRRTAGARHARELDGFITNLANAQQQDATRAGSHFCPLAAPLFGAALSRTSAAELAAFATERNILNIMETPACPAAAPTPPRSTTRTAARNRSAAATR